MANNRDVFQHLDENIELFQGLMRGRWDRSDPGKINNNIYTCGYLQGLLLKSSLYSRSINLVKVTTRYLNSK